MLIHDPSSFSWSTFSGEAPELAETLRARLHNEAMGGLTYFGTSRQDGSPRVNPVKIFVHDSRLLLVTGPKTPKYLDLVRDNRFTFHTAVAANVVETGELAVRGCAVEVTDEAVKADAKVNAPFKAPPSWDWLLLELHLTHVIGVVFNPSPQRVRWIPGAYSVEQLGSPK
jgi:hypothetical protein